MDNLIKNAVCAISYTCRVTTPGDEPESGLIDAYWTGAVDSWGKYTIQQVNGPTRYLFPDEFYVYDPQPPEARAPLPAAPLTVYVLFCETNTGHSDESDGYVIGVYATRELAEADRLKHMDEAIENGTILYFDERTMGEGEDNADDWEADYVVHEHQVIS